jgi:hypothetical protein
VTKAAPAVEGMIVRACWTYLCFCQAQGLLKLYNRKIKQAAQAPQTTRIAIEVGGTLLLDIELVTKHHLDIGKARTVLLVAHVFK